MNTKLITEKTTDLISLLNVANTEASEIEAQRLALEKVSYANSDREGRLQEKEIGLIQKEKEQAEQTKYIEEQVSRNQIILDKITKEKELLANLVEQKRQIGIERLALEEEKQTMAGFATEKEEFAKEKTAFEKDRAIFAQEKIATQEHQKRLTLLDKRLETERIRLQNLYNGV